jgi:putative endopeptidase
VQEEDLYIIGSMGQHMERDQSIAPGDDFYLYVNGDWIKDHPVPPDKTAYDVFTELNDITEGHLRSLVEEAAGHAGAKPASLQRKIGDLYRTGMDTASIERQGLNPITEDLDRISRIQQVSDLQAFIAYLVKCGIGPCFELFAEIDPKNSTMMIAGLAQGGLGLPNREYYLKEDTESEEIRARYQDHIAKMFQFLGTSTGSAREAAKTVMDMETRLAKASYSPEENRDPEATYHKLSPADLNEVAPGIDWTAFFSAIGYPDVREMNVHQPRFFKELGSMISTVGVEEWKIFLRWKLITALAPFLDSRFEQENFAFYGKVLNGQPRMKPRWKRVLATMNFALGDAVGRLYVERYFPPEAKKRMLDLVENLRESFRSRIEDLSWMGPDTKKEALQKLSRIDLKIGYPDTWQEYPDLEIDSDSYVMNVLRAMNYDFMKGPQGLDKAGKPVDRTTWYMHPQTINAYYDPGMNEIVFPAAILQPPFFGMDADDASNYGAIGAVIGHEMTHGFDDMGRKYDRDGNLRDWWTEDDEKEFMRRAKGLADQYGAEEVLPGLPANGRLTLGEDIADLGGLTIAYHAYAKLHKEDEEVRNSEGFTDFQRFFISYATIWRENIRPEALRNRVLSDVHAPNRLRVNCVVFNMPEFYSAFPGIKRESKLFRPPEKRPEIW